MWLSVLILLLPVFNPVNTSPKSPFIESLTCWPIVIDMKDQFRWIWLFTIWRNSVYFNNTIIPIHLQKNYQENTHTLLLLSLIFSWWRLSRPDPSSLVHRPSDEESETSPPPPLVTVSRIEVDPVHGDTGRVVGTSSSLSLLNSSWCHLISSRVWGPGLTDLYLGSYQWMILLLESIHWGRRTRSQRCKDFTSLLLYLLSWVL